MKEFWITLILFIIILGGVIANSIYVSAVSQSLEDFAEEMNYERDSEALLDELQGFWSKHKKFIALSVDTPQIDSVEKIIMSLRLAHERRENFEFEKYRLHLFEASREIARLENLSLQTVF